MNSLDTKRFSSSSFQSIDQILSEIFRYRTLMTNLIAMELTLKYRGSLLGIIWSLIPPLSLILVYTFAFMMVIKINIENFPVFLLSGMLPWLFFSTSTISSTIAFSSNSHLMRKTAFPWQVLPLSRVIFHFLEFLLSLMVVFPLMLFFFGLSVKWSFLALIPVLLLHLIFVVGVTFSVSVLATLVRDLRHLIEVGMQLLFWTTPILYPIEKVPDSWRWFFDLSPLTAFTLAYQEILYRGKIPLNSVAWTISIWTFISLIVGISIFQHNYHRLVEKL